MAFLYLRTYQSSESNKKKQSTINQNSNEKSPSKSNLTFIIYFLNKNINKIIIKLKYKGNLDICLLNDSRRHVCWT